MAKQSLAFIFFAIAYFLLSTSVSGAKVGTNQGMTRSWCIVKPSVSVEDGQLDRNIGFSCSQPVDCSKIQIGGPCYNPNNKVSDASVVMNLDFQKWGRAKHACNFSGSGLIIYNDPSVGTLPVSCKLKTACGNAY